jgi:uracil-DNA glycosylase
MVNNFHAHYLKAMGIQVWIRRHLPPELKDESAMKPTEVQANSEDTKIVTPMSQSVTETPLTQPDIVQTTPPEVEQSDTSIENADIAQTPQPVITNQASASIPAENLESQNGALPSIPADSLESKPEAPKQNWETLRNYVANCTACELHQNRTQTVFGVGHQQADVMLIGEAPGADEDAAGEPFVGRAGQLLNSMLYAIDFKREEVYIANVVKCRPPENRNPKIEEMVSCQSFLQHQIALIQPKLIVAVGRIAAQHLLKTNQAISKIRGQRFFYGEAKIPLIPIFHPAYLLRSPSKKREAWQDLQIIRRTINEILK